jgi:hypothetical protein
MGVGIDGSTLALNALYDVHTVPSLLCDARINYYLL